MLLTPQTTDTYQLAMLAGQCPDPVIRIDSDLTVVCANEAADQIIARWKSSRPQIAQTVTEVLANGEIQKLQLKCGQRVFSLMFVPCPKGSFVNIYGHDITETVKMESRLSDLNDQLELAVTKLERSNEGLHEFAHMVAHDLKSPLRGIGTLAEWIATDIRVKMPQADAELFELLHMRAKRMNRVLEDALRYCTVGQDVKLENVNVRHMLNCYKECASLGHIRLKFEGDFPVINCSRALLETALFNLLDNAIRYVDKPVGTVTVRCCASKAFWKFSISDNGRGIDQKYFEKIFKPFTRLQEDDSFSTGIGLALVRKAADLLDGAVWVDSAPKKGSIFYLAIRMNKPENKLQGQNNEKQ